MSARKHNAQRLHMAQIAARLMHEQGIRDFHTAKRKAAEHLGLSMRDSLLPSNREIEAALAEHLRLFAGDRQGERLDDMRMAALEAMDLMAAFQPRLVGDVLTGLVDAHSDIQLHAFADASETFELFLQQQGIPCDIVERRLRITRNEHAFFPAFQFAAGDFGFEIILLPDKALRQPPLSLVDGAPMQRAGRNQVERLLADARV